MQAIACAGRQIASARAGAIFFICPRLTKADVHTTFF
jgi:hypothetical protein